MIFKVKLNLNSRFDLKLDLWRAFFQEQQTKKHEDQDVSLESK